MYAWCILTCDLYILTWINSFKIIFRNFTESHVSAQRLYDNFTLPQGQSQGAL